MCQQVSDLLHSQPFVVVAGAVRKSLGNLLAGRNGFLLFAPYHLGIDNKVLFVFVSIRCILHRNHDFVQLFALTDAHFLRRMPGAIASARSVILKEGILEIKVSPPFASSNALITSSTP